MRASECGHTAVVSVLLEHDAQVDLKDNVRMSQIFCLVRSVQQSMSFCSDSLLKYDRIDVLFFLGWKPTLYMQSYHSDIIILDVCHTFIVCFIVWRYRVYESGSGTSCSNSWRVAAASSAWGFEVFGAFLFRDWLRHPNVNCLLFKRCPRAEFQINFGFTWTGTSSDSYKSICLDSLGIRHWCRHVL